MDKEELKVKELTEEELENVPEYIAQINEDDIILKQNKASMNTSKSNAGGFPLWIIRMLIPLCFLGMLSGCEEIGSSDYTDSDSSYDSVYEEEQQQLVEQEMPENEHQFVNTFTSRPSKIVVKNPTDYAYYMKFTDAYDNTVFAFFVRPQSETPMYMGLGTFYLKYASGKTWYGEDDLFGPETVYQKDEDSWTFTSDQYWTLTMQATENGNVHTEGIDEDEF